MGREAGGFGFVFPLAGIPWCAHVGIYIYLSMHVYANINVDV